MKNLKILQTQEEFDTIYANGVPSNDVVLIKDSNKVIMSTNNGDGTFREYEGGGTIDASTIDELGLVTVDMIEDFITADDISTKLDAADISTLVSVNDASVYAKLNTTNMGNLYIGSNTSTAGYSVAVRRLFNNLESISMFSNTDFKTTIANRVGSVNNARMILTHEGLEVAYSGNRDTAFPATGKHVTYVEDTSANFAQKNDISTFISLNDVSNHALKSELDFIVWQGSQSQFDALENHTQYKLYLITE